MLEEKAQALRQAIYNASAAHMAMLDAEDAWVKAREASNEAQQAVANARRELYAEAEKE